MSPDSELPGVAALADRPVDGRRAAQVMAAVAVVLALGCGAGVELLLASANTEAEGGRLLRTHAMALEPPSRPAAHLALVLVDGMRVDEAHRLPSWRSLAPNAITGTIAVPTPSLSRPFYHLLFTGVPHDASGVRSNRFDRHARHDSVMDRVRAAGGRVAIVAEDLDWMRRMHGRGGDGGSDRASALRELDAHVARWIAARAPSLLVVHVTSVDHSAHESGITSASHRHALELADQVIARVARADAALVVLSDHGHRAAGGHGGPEPEVVRAPLLVRAAGLAPQTLAQPIAANRLAATLSALLGVPSPREAIGTPALVSSGDPRVHARLASIAQQGRNVERARLLERRTFSVPIVMLLLSMALGPIKRAYGFDRSVAVAIVLWPSTLIGVHLALGRPLTLSAIDTVRAHEVRVALIGLVATVVAFAIARWLGRGEKHVRTWRAAASVGWAALACGLGSAAWDGFALGPWPLGPRELYVPLFVLGAAAPSLLVVSAILLASTRRAARDALVYDRAR